MAGALYSLRPAEARRRQRVDSRPAGGYRGRPIGMDSPEKTNARPGLLDPAQSTRRDLPPAVWLGAPIALLVGRWLAALLPEQQWASVMADETGLIENLTVVLPLPAFVLGVLVFLRRRELPRGVGWWMLLGGLAALFFAGEECSWGQVYLGFRTPDALARINDQNEFNIHRTTNVFNNLLRQLMLAAAIACIVLPLCAAVLPKVLRTTPRWIRRAIDAGRDPRRALYWIAPGYRLALIAAMAVVLRLPDHLKGLLGSPSDRSYFGKAFLRDGGEWKELYFALLILMYLLSVYVRLGRRRRPAGAAQPTGEAP